MNKDLLVLAIEYPLLKKVDSCALGTSLEDIDRVYLNFYKGSGHPKRKKRMLTIVIELNALEILMKISCIQI